MPHWLESLAGVANHPSNFKIRTLDVINLADYRTFRKAARCIVYNQILTIHRRSGISSKNRVVTTHAAGFITERGESNNGIFMAQGRVKWFSVDKGYGFIEPNDGSKDVFVHRNNISNLDWNEGLRDGETVEYETERTPKGISALNVERTESKVF